MAEGSDVKKPVGAGAWVALVAVVAAVGTIGWKLSSDPSAVHEPAAAASDPLAALETDAKANPKDAAGWQRLGFAYFDAGRYSDAANAYVKGTEAAPGNAVLWSSLGEALVIEALEGGALAADLAHAVEEQRLHLVVLGLLGAFEERVVDMGEDRTQQFRQVVHRQLPAALHQLAEARLDRTAGDIGSRRCVLGAHGRSCP